MHDKKRGQIFLCFRINRILNVPQKSTFFTGSTWIDRLTHSKYVANVISFHIHVDKVTSDMQMRSRQ